MNYSDTERIESYLNNLGFLKTPEDNNADLIIFNSCSIRQKAEDRVLGAMRELGLAKGKTRPSLLIALTGCMVRKSSTKKTPCENRDKFIKKIKPLDIAFRIEDLPKLNSLINEVFPKKIKQFENERSEDYFHISPNYSSVTRAFIPISTGCDKFCTYCIVPYSRGREASRHPDDILKEAKTLVENGCKEITLLGQTVDSYGLSNIDRQRHLFNYAKIDVGTVPPPFVQLLERIDKLQKKGLERIRFTSPHPKDVSPELVAAYAELKTLMPHIHLPIQSGDNSCLQRMNRPYTRERYLEIIAALRTAKPDIAITTDIIVGFCGETEEEFQNTLDLYRRVEFDFCYLAQYSERKGTFAAKNLKDDISTKEKARRWHALNDLITEIKQKKLNAYVGKEVEVLVEEVEPIARNKARNKARKSIAVCRGKSQHMKTVQFEIPSATTSATAKNFKGTLQRIRITKAENWILFGELH